MQYAFTYLMLTMVSVSAVGTLVLISYVLTERRASLLEGFLQGLLAPAGMLTLAYFLLKPGPLPLALGSLLLAAVVGALALTYRPVRTI